MTRWNRLTDAERAAITARNQARLGTKWQAKKARHSDFDIAMNIWAARDAYRVQNALPFVLIGGLLLLLLLLQHLLEGKP